jgi:hypothetical protein
MSSKIALVLPRLQIRGPSTAPPDPGTSSFGIPTRFGGDLQLLATLRIPPKAPVFRPSATSAMQYRELSIVARSVRRPDA